MNRNIKLVIVLTLLIILGSCSNEVAVQNSLSLKLSNYINYVYKNENFSGSVLINVSGNTILDMSIGLANRNTGLQISKDTIFRIGSMTKQFTAFCIMILHDAGKLELESSISNYFDGIPEHWKEINIHQLLNMTSGIMHTWELEGFYENMGNQISHLENIRRYYDKPLLFEPGTKFGYSGLGYMILAQIIENVSGYSYEEFVQTEVFDKLGMELSGSDNQNNNIKNKALGYEVNSQGHIVNAPYIYIPVLKGGGELFSTTGDLLKWTEALNSKKILSEESYRKIFTPYKNNYGYGWSIKFSGNETKIKHAGGLPGFSSVSIRIPEKDIFIAVLKNVSNSASTASANGEAMLELISNEIDGH